MLSDADVGRLGALLRTDRFSWARLTDRSGVMVDATRMRMLSLNETGAFVVDGLVAGLGPDALAGRLVEEFAVGADEARKDLEKFLAELNSFVSAEGPGPA